MSKAKQVSQAVAAATKTPKFIRKTVREDAIIWTPGTPPPDAIQIYCDNKISEFMKESDEMTGRNIRQNYIVKHPHNAQDAFSGMLDQISLLSPPDQDRAIAAFMDEVIKVRVWRLDQSQKQEKSAQVNVAKAEEQFYNMQKIQRGDFAIVTPVNYNGRDNEQNLVAKMKTPE